MNKSVDKRIIEWVVLTKAPIPGLVKTRLIPALGEQGACDVYEQLLGRLRKSLKSVVSNTSSQVALWIAGDAEHAAFKPWSDLAVCYQQPATGDLGKRMAMAVQSSLIRGCIPVLIGVDVPDLDKTYLTNCLQQLKKHELVISPAEDGGYGLLGMKEYHPELFVNKNWGTSSVFATTQRDIEKLGIDAAYLPEVWDVDEFGDVQRWLAEEDKN